MIKFFNISYKFFMDMMTSKENVYVCIIVDDSSKVMRVRADNIMQALNLIRKIYNNCKGKNVIVVKEEFIK